MALQEKSVSVIKCSTVVKGVWVKFKFGILKPGVFQFLALSTYFFFFFLKSCVTASTGCVTQGGTQKHATGKPYTEDSDVTTNALKRVTGFRYLTPASSSLPDGHGTWDTSLS